MIRLISVLTLGKHFARDPGVPGEIELITDGLYSRIRHPGHLGEIASFPGVRVVFWYFPASLFITIFSPMAFIYRAPDEEKVFLKEFGREHEEQRKRKRRFVQDISGQSR